MLGVILCCSLGVLWWQLLALFRPLLPAALGILLWVGCLFLFYVLSVVLVYGSCFISLLILRDPSAVSSGVCSPSEFVVYWVGHATSFFHFVVAVTIMAGRFFGHGFADCLYAVLTLSK